MKSIKLIKTVNGASKVIDMPENIWNTILKSPEIIPQGVSYELAPTRPIQATELMPQEQEVEQIEVFTKDESKEVNYGVEAIKERKETPKKQTKKSKR